MSTGPAIGRQRLAYRLREVAELLGVDASTVARWASDGLLTNVRVRGVVLIRPADLETFLDEHTEGRGRVPRRARSLRVAREPARH